MTPSAASTAALFGRAPALVGMVHVGALPGAPRHRRPLREIATAAVAEARLLEEAGFDAVILENMHDVPYLRRHVGPEIVAAMTLVAAEVRAATRLPLGIQILAGANREALAVAHATGLAFVRVEGFVFASVADEGLLEEADAGSLLRYRRMLDAEQVRILADVKKKHSAHAITADVDIAETARAAAFFLADGIVVSGAATGAPTPLDALDAARGAVDLPLLAGSGVRPEDLPAVLALADGVIVGSALKEEDHWANPLDPFRVARMVEAIESYRRVPPERFR